MKTIQSKKILTHYKIKRKRHFFILVYGTINVFYVCLSCLNILKSYFKHIILLPYDYHMAKNLHMLAIWLRFHMVTISYGKSNHMKIIW